MKYNVRCSKEKCRARDVFDKHPEAYDTPRKCRVCGHRKFRVIPNINIDRGFYELCMCMGYMWGDDRTAKAPHRRGSRMCHYRVDGTMRMPGDPDFNDPDYEAYLASEQEKHQPEEQTEDSQGAVDPPRMETESDSRDAREVEDGECATRG